MYVHLIDLKGQAPASQGAGRQVGAELPAMDARKWTPVFCKSRTLFKLLSPLSHSFLASLL